MGLLAKATLFLIEDNIKFLRRNKLISKEDLKKLDKEMVALNLRAEEVDNKYHTISRAVESFRKEVEDREQDISILEQSVEVLGKGEETETDYDMPEPDGLIINEGILSEPAGKD